MEYGGIMKRFLMFAAIMSGAIGSGPAMSLGDAQAGAAKAIVCQACHGPKGNSVNGQWPSLAGLGAGYIAEQLANFKSGKRNNAIMMPMAMALSPQDMSDLAAYFQANGVAPAPTVVAVPVDGAANTPTGSADGPDGELAGPVPLELTA